MAYRGLIAEIPAGLQGFNGSKNASKLQPGHFGYVEGVDIDGEVLVKDGGAQKLNAVALGAPSAIMSGFNWTPIPATPADVVFLSNGQIRKDLGAGTFATLMATCNIPSIYPPFFVRAGGEVVGQPRKLFLFNEADQVQVILGNAATAADIAAPAADWASSFPMFGVQHGLRLWGGGNANDPHRIYYSSVASHETFTGADTGSLAIYPGEGEGLVGGLSFRGLLILFKYPQGVYMVDTRDVIANWRVDRLNDAVGAASPWCVLQISNDVLIMDPSAAIHQMSSVTDFSDLKTSDITRPQNLGPFTREFLSLVNMRKAMGAWYADKAKAWFMVPMIGTADNNLRIVVDFNNAQVGARYLLSRRDVGKALWMRPDATNIRKPTLGDDDGFVWLMDDDERNKDGAAYTMNFETSENDFSSVDPTFGPRTKNGQYIEVTSDLVSNSTIQLTPVWDGFVGQPINFLLGTSGAVLDSFVLDVDVLSALGTVTTQEKLNGQGRRLKLIGLNEDPNDDVRISSIVVGFTLADERLRSGS